MEDTILPRYMIESNVIIKEWVQKAICYFKDQGMRPFSLDREELKLLERCDGKTQVGPSAIADRLQVMRVIRKCARETDGLTSGEIIRYPNYYVRSIDWAITDRCNYNCLHCFHAADNDIQRNEFSFQDALRLLDDIRSCGIPSVRLTGGEPTLYPHFRELLKAIYERELQLDTLVTNGSKLTAELLGYIKELFPLARIMISFDGIGFHDWMRRHPGSEEEAKRAVRLSVQAGLSVFINSNVNRRNMDVMYDTFLMLADLGVEQLRIIRTTEAPRWELNKNEDTLSPEEYYDFSCRFAQQYKQDAPDVPVIIWQSLSLDKENRSFSCLPVKTTPERFCEDRYICSAFFQKLYVQANGDVEPCAPFAGYNALHDIHPGNIYTESLKSQLTNGRILSEITQTIGDKIRKNETCASCCYVRACQGGCPALSVISGGSMLSSDLYKCIFFRKGYYERMCHVLEGWNNQMEDAGLSNAV